MKNPDLTGECAKCGDNECELYPCEGGLICDRCLERGRKGRDITTRAARTEGRAKRHQANAELYRAVGDEDGAATYQRMANTGSDKAQELYKVTEPVEIAKGEVVSPRRPLLRNTLKTPDHVALDASAHRVDLLTTMGNDCVAMAMDAADSMNAENSLEKMLAHQLALCHKVALETIDKSLFERDAAQRVKLVNAGARMMETFQRGLLCFQQLRSRGEQHITVQHVTVTSGGQAIVGSVQTGGGSK